MMTTNALLGYPDDARLLIINADDFGMTHSNNEAIMHALRDGVVTSTSLMVPCPWAPQALQFLRDNPDVPFAVHLTLVSEFVPCRWGPVASRRDVPSLIDERGHFLPDERRAEILSRAHIHEVEIEFRAQIETVLADGLRPTHLDFHCLPDGDREDIYELTFGLAREYGMAMRVHFRHHALECQEMRLPVNDHTVLDSYSMDPATKADRYRELIRTLPAGLSEWAVHPSLGNEESRALEPGTWQIRKADYDVMIDPGIRSLLEEEGIILIDYRRLQQVWADQAP